MAKRTRPTAAPIVFDDTPPEPDSGEPRCPKCRKDLQVKSRDKAWYVYCDKCPSPPQIHVKRLDKQQAIERWLEINK